MTAVTYTAKRRVVSGHTVDSSYDLNLPLSKITKKPKVNKKEHFSLDGSSQTLFHNVIDYISLVTSDIEESEAPKYREFLYSVIGGEPFFFDERGTAETPDDPVLVKIEGGHSENLVGQTLNYKYTFRVRVL